MSKEERERQVKEWLNVANSFSILSLISIFLSISTIFMDSVKSVSGWVIFLLIVVMLLSTLSKAILESIHSEMKKE